MRKYLFLFLALTSITVIAQPVTDLEILVLSFKALKNDVYNFGNTVYRPANKEDGFVEIKIRISNHKSTKTEFDLNNLLLEGSGVVRRPRLIFANTLLNRAFGPIVKLDPADSKERKLIYSFPDHLSATNLVVNNDYKIPLSENLLEERVYFSKEGKTVQSPDSATFYRITEKMNDNWIIRDYSVATETLMRESELSSLYPMVKNGHTTLYHDNGSISESGSYADNERSGLFTEYFESGNIKSRIDYQEKNTRFLQIWNESGDSLLIKGTGVVEVIHDDGDKEISRYGDYALNANLLIRKVQRDTLFVVMSTMPQYPEGLSAFANHVDRTMVYPKEAKKNKVQGRVGVTFVIDKQGNLDEFAVLNRLGSGLDEEAIRILSTSGQWIPGSHQGAPVKVRMVIYINFLL